MATCDHGGHQVALAATINIICLSGSSGNSGSDGGSSSGSSSGSNSDSDGSGSSL